MLVADLSSCLAAVCVCLTITVAVGVVTHPCLIAQGYGYKCQEYNVSTEDGYVLGLQRIMPNATGGAPPSVDAVTGGQPVLLQHGILVDGASWMLNGREQGLPFLLADGGFDVWIANSRGTRPSRAHKFLNADKQRAYWAWTWDELAAFDLPAFLDFVHDQTGLEVHYVGHSLGTLTAMAWLSQQTSVKKMSSAALLCPIAYLSHMRIPLLQMAAREYLSELVNIFGTGEFVPKIQYVDHLLKSICSQPGIDCEHLLAALSGRECCVNSSLIDLMFNYEPQPTSTKNIVHLAQMVRSGTVSKYDNGNILMNMFHYWSTRPSAYDLSKIPLDLPLFVGYGGQDAIADVDDIEFLHTDRLKFHQNDKLKVHFVEEYGHLDFIMGSNVKQKVYNDLIAFLKDLPLSS